MAQDQNDRVRASVETAFRTSLKEVLKNKSPEAKEIECVVQLCLMAVAATGKEDPRALMAGVGDILLKHLVINMEAMQASPVTRPVSQFFFIEWCFRQGHLKEDWKWIWDNQKDGRLLYRPAIPLDQVPKPVAEHIDLMNETK